MHLIYLDESGNSGNNLSDPQQPIFVLGALIVPEQKWKAIEHAVTAQVEFFFEGFVPEDYEIHASEIRAGRGVYKGMDLKKRMAYRDALMQIPVDFELPFIYRAITKKRFSTWLEQAFGKGVFINPHIAAYPLVSQTINTFLRDVGEDTLGILINDENKEVVADIEAEKGSLRKNINFFSDVPKALRRRKYPPHAPSRQRVSSRRAKNRVLVRPRLAKTAAFPRLSGQSKWTLTQVV